MLVHRRTPHARAASRAPLVAAILVAACAGRTPAPDVAPAPSDAPATPAPAPSAPTATRFTWGAAERRIEVHTDAVITRDGPAAPGAAAASSTANGEHVVSTAYLTTVLAPADAPGATTIHGTVDSLVVSASDRVRGTAPDATTPAASPTTSGTPSSNRVLAGLAYRGASDARGIRIEAADPGTDLHCSAPTGAASLSALSAVREALPRIPANLAPGARWRDTTVTASCAGPVVLVAQTIARYESAADPNTPGRLRVTRQSTTTARGQGTAGIRPMSVVASGTARAVYALDAARGQLVDGTGDGRTTVTVTLAGVAQRFTQQTRTQLVLR